jgi:hypothetical protein
MRLKGQRLTRVRLRYEGSVVRIYEMERGGEWVGYWTSRDAGLGATAWRGVRWLVLRRTPRRFYPMVPEVPAPQTGTSPPQAPGDPLGSVREPRRPIRPTLSGAAELPLPDGD